MTVAPISPRRRKHRPGRPLFIRVFIVMLVCVLAAQVASALVILLSPKPFPQLFTIGEIGTTLKTGYDATGRLAVGDAAGPPIDAAGSDGVRRALARELGVPIDAVRLSQGARGAVPGPHGFIKGNAYLQTGWLTNDQSNVIVGSFSAAVRHTDGRWTVATARLPLFDRWRSRILIWFFVAFLLVAPCAWFLARRLAAPIGAFAAAAERLGRDPLAPPLALRGPREIEHASSAFNEMQEQLRRFVDDRTTMIGAIAHDLLNPLMRIAFRIEEVPDAVGRKIEIEIAEMKDMLVTVLDFVRGVQRTDPRQPIELRALLEDIVETFVDTGDDVSLAPGADIVLEADPLALRSIFVNLVANAVRYGDRARIRLTVANRIAVVDVEDDGRGLPDAELERVFEPFYRIEPSRNKSTGGTGLGLALVRSFVRLHGGEAALANRPEGGLVARITLPV